MLDIKLLREDKENVISNLKKRIGFDTSIVDNVLELDSLWRKEKNDLDNFKSKKNKESKAIAQIKKDGGNIKAQLEKVKEISKDIESQEKKVKGAEEKRNKLLINIPNLLDKSVPVGADDEDNVEIRTHLEKPEFDFKVKNHQEICERNDFYDLDTASKYAGARFYYLKSDLVILQMALYNFVLSKLSNKGYTPIIVPPMLRRDAIGKSVSLEDFKEAIYEIKGEDLCLIGTAEHALALLHADQTLVNKDLPIKYVGISESFRKEAGVTKDEKGIFRVHNFAKIEQFIFSRQEESEELLEELINNAEEIYQDLELHYRIVNICSGDIGSFAAKKYDLEAWLPGQNKYREMVSASNYRDYGARRLNTKYQDEKNNLKLVHTLNSTAIALTRTLIAILEQHQNEDGTVNVPEKLQLFMHGKKVIGKTN